MSLIFRWLGVAGLELKAGGQTLVIDPFFTRPSLIDMLRPVSSDSSLVAKKIPVCDFVLVTHPHYDHLMDVPTVLQHTRAVAYGSANTCQLLRLHGVPEAQMHELQVGDTLSLGAYKVDVIAGQHSPLPFGRLFNGKLKADLRPPLRMQDYRMDICLGYAISVMGESLLICAAESRPADVFFTVAQESQAYYLKMLQSVQPRIFIPIHWDNFTRPLSKPLRGLTRPGRLHLKQLANLASQVLPQVKVIIPEIFQVYTLTRDKTEQSGQEISINY